MYTSPLTSFGRAVVENDLTFKNFAGTLLFLQTILCRPFGSNGPLWSIANEFWYYVLFPVALLAAYAWAAKSWRTALPLTLLAIAVAVMLGPEKLLGFLIWLSGVAVLLLSSRSRLASGISRAAAVFFSSGLLAVCLAAARNGKFTPQFSDLIVGLAFSVFLLGVLQLEFAVPPDGTYLRNARLFAGFSYTLYVLHFPFLLFLRAAITPGSRWQPDAVHLLYGAAIGVMVLSFSWLVARFTEHRTGEARRQLMKAFGLGGSSQPTPRKAT